MRRTLSNLARCSFDTKLQLFIGISANTRSGDKAYFSVIQLRSSNVVFSALSTKLIISNDRRICTIDAGDEFLFASFTVPTLCCSDTDKYLPYPFDLLYQFVCLL